MEKKDEEWRRRMKNRKERWRMEKKDEEWRRRMKNMKNGEER